MNSKWSTMIVVAGVVLLATAWPVTAAKTVAKAKGNGNVPLLENTLDIDAQAAAICGGDQDHVYAVSGKSVTMYDSKGESVKKWTLPDGIAQVAAMALDADGALFVGGQTAEGLAVVKVKMGDTATMEATWKVPGAMTGLKVGKDGVFVADSKGRCIRMLDPKTGKLVRTIGHDKSGQPNGTFATCCGILDFAIDKNNRLVVGNLGQYRVTTCSATGVVSGNWGAGGDRPADFCGCCNPVSVAVTADGKVVTAEKTIPRVKVYGAGGRPLLAMSEAGQFPPSCGKLPVVTDAEGTIYALDCSTGKIKVFKLPSKK